MDKKLLESLQKEAKLFEFGKDLFAGPSKGELKDRRFRCPHCKNPVKDVLVYPVQDMIAEALRNRTIPVERNGMMCEDEVDTFVQGIFVDEAMSVFTFHCRKCLKNITKSLGIDFDF